MRKEGPLRQEQLASVAHALMILRMLKTRHSLRVTEVAKELGLAPSTAHRLLSTMRSMGFLEQEHAGRAYRAGWEMVEMELVTTGQLDIRDYARPVLEGLRDEFNETANLVILEGRYIRFIDGVESRNPVRVAIRTGQRIPAPGTAAGKVLLSERSIAHVRRLFDGQPLVSAIGRTPIRFETFADELANVRARGYATNFAESVPDLHAVGVKVVDGQGRAVAALTLSFPGTRLRRSDAPRIASVLLLASADLTRRAWHN
jgi:DNA-binding IclR family transcriptional regulator